MLFHEVRKLQRKPASCHMYESFVVRFLHIKWCKGRNIDVIAAFTFQKEDILCRVAEAGRETRDTNPPILNQDEKHPFLFSSVLRLFKKAYLCNNTLK